MALSGLMIDFAERTFIVWYLGGRQGGSQRISFVRESVHWEELKCTMSLKLQEHVYPQYLLLY